MGLLVSLLAHALLFLIWQVRPLPLSPFSAAGPKANDDRAAFGGGMQAVQLSYEASAPQASQPKPVPVPDPEVEQKPVPEEKPQPKIEVSGTSVEATTVGTLGEGSAGAGPGRADGTGRGAGGTEGEGADRGIVPPSPRGLILPPSERPTSVRGKEIAVWVYVTREGEVVADSTRLDPGSGDRGFDRRLRDLAAEWVFHPATKAGRPVAEWFRYVLVL